MAALIRKYAGWAVAIFVALLCMGVYVRYARRLSLIELAQSLPADGRVHRIAVARRHWPFTVSAAKVVSDPGSPGIHAVNVDDTHFAIYERTPVLPGRLRISFRYAGIPYALTLHAMQSDEDSFGDGTPDYLRLHTAADREAFRSWFTALALQAADAAPGRLPPEITDCASLLRWAYRQTLLEHDDRWYRQFAPGEMPSLPSVQQWTYPNTPLSAQLFRVMPGRYRRSDVQDGAFAQFADAKTLFSRNAFALGRDLHLARPGDLLFFHQLEQHSTYHSMIVTEKQGAWVVYHTGPVGNARGEMRRVVIDDLLHHPDPRWHPVAGNSNFLGVFRWNILREDDQ